MWFLLFDIIILDDVQTRKILIVACAPKNDRLYSIATCKLALDNLLWCVIVRRKESEYFKELHLLQIRVKTYTYIAFKAGFIQRSQYTFHYVPSFWDYSAFEQSHFISSL